MDNIDLMQSILKCNSLGDQSHYLYGSAIAIKLIEWNDSMGKPVRCKE